MGKIGGKSDAKTGHTKGGGDPLYMMRKTAAAVVLLGMLLMPVSAAELNPAEMTAMAEYIAVKTEGEPYAVRLALAAVLLNQLEDPRYPDTVSGILAAEGYRSIRRSREYASARSALRAALEGMDITDGAVEWAYRGTPAGVVPHLTLGEWVFGEG